MDKAKLPRVKQLSVRLKWQMLITAIHRIAGNGVTNGLHMHPNLMSPPCFKPKSDIGKIADYSYAKIALNNYSCKYSKKLYSQPALFTIIALKIYLKMTYRQIMDFISFSDALRKYLKIKKAPDYSTIQKFFKRMPTNMFERITEQIIQHLEIKPTTAALDDTGFTNDYADKYYAQIKGKERKSYTKCHIAVDIDTKIILYSQALKCPKHDTQFAIASIRSLKKYNIKYIITDKAYDTNKIRECINEEIKASNQIPLKSWKLLSAFLSRCMSSSHSKA